MSQTRRCCDWVLRKNDEDDLTNYDKTVMCKCGGCTCRIAADLEKKRDKDKVHQFLWGLDGDVYGLFVPQSSALTRCLPGLLQDKIFWTGQHCDEWKRTTRCKDCFCCEEAYLEKKWKTSSVRCVKGQDMDWTRHMLPSGRENKRAKLEEVVAEEDEVVIKRYPVRFNKDIV